MRPGARGSAAALSLLLAACEGPQSALDPKGPAAARIEDLWWVMFWIAAVVGAISLAVLCYAIFRRRPDEQEQRGHSPAADHAPTRWILIGGFAAPVAILVVLYVLVLRTLGALADPDARGLAVEVTGNQWWWDVRYLSEDPAEMVRTANEIHIPVGQRVYLQLRSRDVIHSFWVPQLNGKMDLIPGRTNRIWIQADRPGVYRGQCAEYCGLQHTHMALLVVAQEPAEFDAWLEHQRQPARPAEAKAARPEGQPGLDGQTVFESRGCVLCHAVRGTEARAVVGPDLTHLASRRTLAAGMIPNTRGHLAGWIANPQQIKPGNRMPRVPLSNEEIRALLHYLESLE